MTEHTNVGTYSSFQHRIFPSRQPLSSASLLAPSLRGLRSTASEYTARVWPLHAAPSLSLPTPPLLPPPLLLLFDTLSRLGPLLFELLPAFFRRGAPGTPVTISLS